MMRPIYLRRQKVRRRWPFQMPALSDEAITVALLAGFVAVMVVELVRR